MHTPFVRLHCLFAAASDAHCWVTRGHHIKSQGWAYTITSAFAAASEKSETFLRRFACSLDWLGSQVLALLTWRDFGWRLHSRLGVDFRQRGARERRRLHSAQAVFVTLIKFDVMWEVRISTRLGSSCVFACGSRPSCVCCLHCDQPMCIMIFIKRLMTCGIAPTETTTLPLPSPLNACVGGCGRLPCFANTFRGCNHCWPTPPQPPACRRM